LRDQGSLIGFTLQSLEPQNTFQRMRSGIGVATLRRHITVLVVTAALAMRTFTSAQSEGQAPRPIPAERAWEWYRQQPWIVGFNYVPSTAANTTEFWSTETFDEQTINRELGWGAGLGFNSCRVFVQYLVWKSDPAGLLKRLDRFLQIANQHGLTTTLVLFDDCALGDPPQTEPYLGKQRDPIPGMILPSWTPSPGLKAVTDKSTWGDLEKYIKEIVGAFARDRRVLMWDLYNEPGNSDMGNKSLPLVEATFLWARSVNPSQPLTMGVWSAPLEISQRQLDLSDVISFHFYGNHRDLESQITHFRRSFRPVINTEWMARPRGSRWETDLPLFKQQGVGCYSWGLVNGRTQAQFAWDSKRDSPEPKVWFHDLFHRDGRPYDPKEHEIIRQITLNKVIDWKTIGDPALKANVRVVTEDGIKFLGEWTRWTGGGPRNGRLFYSNAAGSIATFEANGPSVTLIHKVGPDCGMALILIDGVPAPLSQLDTYAPTVEWNRRTVIATDLPADRRHIITLVTLGTRNDSSSNAYVQVVNFE
jgi:hypothetical protein